jgi:hypothetical protein
MTEPPWLPVAPRTTRIGFSEGMMWLCRLDRGLQSSAEVRLLNLGSIELGVGYICSIHVHSLELQCWNLGWSSDPDEIERQPTLNSSCIL